MKFLGIDYGKKKVGLALSEGALASPLDVIAVSSLQDALIKIEKVIGVEKIDTVVIGVAESGESKAIAKKFITELKKQVPFLQVIEVDEHLSTQKGKQAMVELGVKKSKRKEDDSFAAATILQDYLDSHR